MTLWREPTLHFALGGLLLFGLWAVVGERSPESSDIVVTGALVDSLTRQHAQTTGQAPTPEELDLLIAGWVRQEVLYREALRMELDQADPIVRRRLVQKLELLLEDLTVPEPTDPDLAAWLAQYPARYAHPERVAFDQVYVGDADPAPFVAELLQGHDPAAVGRPFAHGVTQPLASYSRHADRFGSTFADQLVGIAPMHGWKAVSSSYGTHLVRVTEHRPERDATLAEVREAVARDWLVDARQRLLEEAIAERVARYSVIR